MWRKIKRILADRKNQKKYVRWLLRQIKPYKGRIVFLLLACSGITLLGVSTAVINKYIVDRASASLGLVAGVTVAIAVSAGSLVLSAGAALYGHVLNERFSFETRIAIYKSLMQIQWKKLQLYHSEDILTRLTSDVNAVTNGIVTVAVSLVTLPVQLVSAFFLLLRYDRTLAFFIIIVSPVAATASLVFGLKLREIQKKYKEAEAKYRVYLQEHITHLLIIKVFSYEAESEKELQRIRDERLYWVKKKNWYSVIASTCMGGAFSGGYLLAFIRGVFQIAAGTITYGTMTAFLSLVNQIQVPVNGLAGAVPQIVSVLASAGRIMDIDGLEREAEAKPPDKKAVGPFGIRGNHLWFSYDKTRKVLRDFSMDIKPGNIAAVMGHSGVGKTTLVRLLLGFLSAQRGELVYYDEENRVLPCSPLTRAYVSYVPQGNTLFSGTLEENIRVGNPEAAKEDIMDALEKSCAWRFIETLPLQMDTAVGERACGLSEGQAQRLAIARALIKPSSVLILDEATSALDEETERSILAHLKAMEHRPTCFVVSHRSSVLEFADQVITLEEHIDG